MVKVEVDSPTVRYSADLIEADYVYSTSEAKIENNVCRVRPRDVRMTFRTKRRVPRLGVMLVGIGGNNGSTVVAATLANKLGLSWRTKDKVQQANYYGSITQASTVSLGSGPQGEVHVPLKDLLPMVNPNEVLFDGWDISNLNLAEAMRRARVLDVQLQDQLAPHMEKMRPRPGIFDPIFVAANQEDRANNIIPGNKQQQLQRIRDDIREFTASAKVDKVIVLWTANTERYCDVLDGVHDTAANLLAAIENDHPEVSPSTIFAVASVLEGCTYINGSPQNTFVPGLQELARQRQVFLAGDDFKSGQTKLKSVLVDFLVSAGIKPVSIVSYNHLGNNDGKNLSAPAQFRSKEISKSNVVDDMVNSNSILYAPGEKPDHCVVIKYVPYVGDSKRAMDEYTSEILLGGHNTIVVHNTCEDSLLAAPLIIDLFVLAELCERIEFSVAGSKFQGFHSILSLLSYLCKAPAMPPGAPVVNALFKQRCCIVNVLRACVGLAPCHFMDLEYKASDVSVWERSTSMLVPDESGSKKQARSPHEVRTIA